ncbi:hypothetical protein FS837_008889 [Tulasnella sp. UAMH 9824]|nr:hypothetical protein FS837_008889 [Tulasnella sp. UAMH 9824]
MQKIRALARRGSGRVVPPPPPARRASTSGQDIRGSNSSQHFLLPPQASAAPEEHGGRVSARSGSTNALATLGRKIFGSHHRRHHNASSKHGDGSAREDPQKKKHQSTDLIGVFSRPRARTGEESFMSGGTSLMDMQALAHVNRTTSGVLARHDDAPDPFAGDLTPRRRASEIVRELDSVLGYFLPDASEGVITGSTSALAGCGIEQGKDARAEDRDGRHDSDSIVPSPPTPQPRCPLRDPSPKPRRHQRKRSQSSFILPTSRRVDQRIINHSDLDLCILLGNIARRNRGIRVTPPRKSQTSRKTGLPPPPPPRCPAAPDVFIVDDTVKRNRRMAMAALTARDPEEKDVRGLVRSPKFEDNLAQMVNVVEDPAADDDAEVATVRGWASLSGLLQLCSPAPEDVDPDATVKRRSNTKEKDTGLQSRFSLVEPKKQEKIRLSPLNGFLPPAKPWKFKDLEKLPCVEPADRFAGIVRWVADVQEALAMEAVLDVPYTAKVPQPYVPYWHFP